MTPVEALSAFAFLNSGFGLFLFMVYGPEIWHAYERRHVPPKSRKFVMPLPPRPVNSRPKLDRFGCEIPERPAGVSGPPPRPQMPAKPEARL